MLGVQLSSFLLSLALYTTTFLIHKLVLHLQLHFEKYVLRNIVDRVWMSLFVDRVEWELQRLGIWRGCIVGDLIEQVLGAWFLIQLGWLIWSHDLTSMWTSLNLYISSPSLYNLIFSFSLPLLGYSQTLELAIHPLGCSLTSPPSSDLGFSKLALIGEIFNF